MSDMWGAKYLEHQVDRAWMDLRLRLADRFVEALANEDGEPLDISTATGETLTVSVDDDHVVVIAGDNVITTANVDEAAYAVYRILHDEWQVVHPIFLDTVLVDVPSIPDAPVGADVVVPTLGVPESKEQLQAWVVATFQEGRAEKLKVARNGDVRWSSRRGEAVVVSVRNDARIEIWSVLAREVSFRKAHKAIDRLSSKHFGIKFFLRQDVLMMSRTLVAAPFVGEHLTSALGAFSQISNELGDVADEVLRSRVKVERADLAKAEKAKAAAEAALAEAQERAQKAERIAERRKLEQTWVSRNFKKAKAERDAAQAELASLKAMLEKALGQQQPRQLPLRLERGESA